MEGGRERGWGRGREGWRGRGREGGREGGRTQKSEIVLDPDDRHRETLV